MNKKNKLIADTEKGFLDRKSNQPLFSFKPKLKLEKSSKLLYFYKKIEMRNLQKYQILAEVGF